MPTAPKYSAIIGKARASMVHASGVGVIIAAKTKISMTAIRQPLSITRAGSTSTTLSTTRKTGSRKATPKARMNRMTKSR